MKTIIISFLFIIFCNFLNASNDNYPTGARPAGLGNSTVAVSDFWAIHHNQAGIADLQHISAGFYYESKFFLHALSLKSGAVIFPTNSGTFGINFCQFGYSAYNESKYGLAYAKTLGEKISAGIQLNYFHTHINEEIYGNANIVTAEIGLQALLNEQIRIGGHIFNPTRVRVASYNDERMPTVFRIGLSYEFPKLLVSFETEKDIDYDPVFKAGMEYHPIRQLFLRGGISTSPVIYSFGLGLDFKYFQIDFATSHHQTLGYTPHFSLIYNIANLHKT